MSYTSDNGRRVFALEVGGLIYRYHSGGGTEGLLDTIATGINYVDVEGIVSVGAFGASIDPSGGVGQYEPIEVTLGINKRQGLQDPGIIFGRCGARSITTKAKITANVDRDDSFIRVDTDLRTLSFPRLMHIGAETVRVSTASAIILNVPAGRGAGNTPLQNHSIDLEGVKVPEITSEITTFRGRRAKLYMSHQYPDGSLSDWAVVCNGFIESTPTIDQGDTVSLSLVPMVALIDQVSADKGLNQTRLLEGYHYFGDDAGNTLEYGMQLELSTSHVHEMSIDDSSTLTANTLSIISGTNILVQDFDESLPTGLDSNGDPYTSVAHPRFPRLLIGSLYPAYPTSISATTNAAGRDVYLCALDSTPSGTVTTAQAQRSWNVMIETRMELKQHTISGLKQWPNVINDTLESDGPSSTQGNTGGLLKWRLDEQNQLIVSKLSDSDKPSKLTLWTRRDTLRSALDDRFTYAQYWDGDFPNPALQNHLRLWYPIDLGEGEEELSFAEDRSQGLILNVVVSAIQPNSAHQLRDVAKAYYQHREDRLLVEDSLGLPTTAGSDRFDIVVSFYDRRSQSIKEQVFKATHQSTATFSGTNVGYYIHLDRNYIHENQSFADWSNGERALITRGGRYDSERPGAAILKLLMSGGGQGYNSVYDVFAVGCNLNSNHIDIDSFLSIDSASPFTVSGQFLGVGADVRSMIDDLLKLLGACMVMKRNAQGQSLITLIPVGAERSADTVVNIAEGDWLVDPPPHWDSYEDIVTQIKYEYDFDPIEEKYKSEVIFNNQEAISRYGGERSQITLTLPGVSSDQFGRGAGDVYAEFLPTSQRIFNLLSNPLRVWRGSIGTGKSALLDLGSYVTASSPHLRGYGDSYGVTNGIGFIRSIRQELMGEGCDLELLTTGLSPVAWNATATVATIPTGTTVTVNQNDFSRSSVDDSSFFTAGDHVDYLPLGDHDNGITGLVIQSISGNTITFTAAHGISAAGGTLEPTTYGSASDEHKQDAYLANASNVIDSTEEAQEYS
jgi:hypothetical protein